MVRRIVVSKRIKAALSGFRFSMIRFLGFRVNGN